jgi:hypothetical protein
MAGIINIWKPSCIYNAIALFATLSSLCPILLYRISPTCSHEKSSFWAEKPLEIKYQLL